jgi:hypothetical protein
LCGRFSKSVGFEKTCGLSPDYSVRRAKARFFSG